MAARAQVDRQVRLTARATVKALVTATSVFSVSGVEGCLSVRGARTVVVMTPALCRTCRAAEATYLDQCFDCALVRLIARWAREKRLDAATKTPAEVARLRGELAAWGRA
jgi:hypothetical protein